MMTGMEERTSLPTLLAQTLVAFTIEADNEFERLAPHRTTKYGPGAGGGDLGRLPWLVSLAMWAHFLRHVDEEGTRGDVLAARTGLGRAELTTWLQRLSLWWGYLEIVPGANPLKPGPDWVARPTRGGRKAMEVWRGLAGTIEARWARRYGRDEMSALRAELERLGGQIAAEIDLAWPEYLPILGYGLFSRAAAKKKKADEDDGAERTLTALLTRPLLAFAMEFEAGFPLSLAVCADLLRLVEEEGVVATRELPRRSGVSSEALTMAMGLLKKRGCVKLATEKRRGKIVWLTELGRADQAAYLERVRRSEAEWKKR
jgi:DNA-binding MarR family transcriptional regulator